jgi:hypothetical protein
MALFPGPEPSGQPEGEDSDRGGQLDQQPDGAAVRY